MAFFFFLACPCKIQEYLSSSSLQNLCAGSGLSSGILTGKRRTIAQPRRRLYNWEKLKVNLFLFVVLVAYLMTFKFLKSTWQHCWFKCILQALKLQVELHQMWPMGHPAESKHRPPSIWENALCLKVQSWRSFLSHLPCPAVSPQMCAAFLPREIAVLLPTC